MFFVVKRATLLIPSGPEHDPDRKHLFVCVTDPLGAARETLIVSLSSVRAGEWHDPACKLHPGDHPFVKATSFVNYRFARIESADKLERGVREGKLTPHEPLGSEVFAYLCRGLEESSGVAPKILDFYCRALGR
jgi:hypothetical protein